MGYSNLRGQPFNPQSVRAMIGDRSRGSAGQATQIKGASVTTKACQYTPIEGHNDGDATASWSAVAATL